MGRKFISQKALSELPEVSDTQCICKVTETRGGGVFQVSGPNPLLDLVTLPSKFNRLIWVRRGTYVIVEPDLEAKAKIRGEIVHILLPQDIKELKGLGKWCVLLY